MTDDASQNKRNEAKRQMKELVRKISNLKSTDTLPHERDIENVVDAIIDAAVDESKPYDATSAMLDA